MKTYGNGGRTSIDELDGINELLEYITVDTQTGICVWSKKPNRKTLVGSTAGSKSNGYNVIGFKDNNYRIHRIVFYVAHGYLPLIVDHKHGKDAGDGIDNLQEVTQQQNLIKKSMQRNNKTGFRGVCWDKRTEKFMAYITKDGKRTHLGRFDTAIEASIVYESKAKEFFGIYYTQKE